MQSRLQDLRGEHELVEAQRLEQRTTYDLEMLQTVGMVKGIENYSGHLSMRKADDPPPTLIDYFPKDFLLVIDESHQIVPQGGAISAGTAFARRPSSSTASGCLRRRTTGR